MMTSAAPNAAPPAGHTAYGDGYERMRRHAVEPGAAHESHGLGVVALRGLAAWLHAFAELPAPPAACGSAAPETLPAGAGRAVLDIVVAMLESHMEGVSA